MNDPAERDPAERDLAGRARALIDRAVFASKGAPAAGDPLAGEPADLTALWAIADGLELADGTRILPRAEVAGATAWLVEEKALGWDASLWAIGERDDLVVVRDLDASRAGGGVLETPTDGLSALRRVALDVVGYLEGRAGEDEGPAPERAAREAIARGDEPALAAAIARGFYPGSDRDLAHASLSLGALRAAAGDHAGAMDAFELSVASRVRAAPRGAERSEAAAAWRACAITAGKAGAPVTAEACRLRAA